MKTIYKKELPKEAKELIHYITEYIKSSPNYDKKQKKYYAISLAMLRIIAYDYLEVLKLDENNYQEYVQKIKDFSFLDKGNYNYLLTEDHNINVSNFRDELIIAIIKTYDKNYVPQILVRQKSPPTSAYEKQGDSMLNIKTSKEDYYYLFAN